MKKYTVIGYYEEEPQCFAFGVDAENPDDAARAAVEQACPLEDGRRPFQHGVMVVVGVVEGSVPLLCVLDRDDPVRATELVPEEE
jgi:hypothetical protein